MGITDKYNNELRHIEYAVEKYGNMLFRICFSLLTNEADAEDALQDTFMRYMTKAPLFNDSDHEKAWLIKVATNICKNMLRYRKRHACLNIEDFDNIGVSTEDSEILELLMQLPVKYKTVLHLYYIEGYRSKEIAEIINISPAAVRKRLQHGRNMLRHELEGSGLIEIKQHK